MPDAKRMEIINKSADHMDSNYNDMQQFNKSKRNTKPSKSRR